MIVLNIKNWNENRVVQLEENWTLEWKQGNFEPRNLGMKTFLQSIVYLIEKDPIYSFFVKECSIH